MTGMTPEEHLGALIAAYEDANREDRALCEPSVRVKVNQGALAAADLIRERDAEVRADERAKVLAGFVEEHTKFWEHDEGTGRLRRSAVGVRHRRLVSPWEPTP